MTYLVDIERFVLDSGSDNLPTFGGKFEGGIQLQQVFDEISPCILYLLESGYPIKSYLEIGVAAGGTTFLINHFFKPATIVLIDDNQHPKAHVRPHTLRDIVYQEIIGNSHSQGAIDQISKTFDLIIIDGDHSYEGVKLDVENYTPFLNAGGFLVFHDSCSHGLFGVNKAVEELKSNTAFIFIKEYITTKHTRACGLALFRKTEAQF